MNRYINENDKKMDELLQKYIAGNASEKEYTEDNGVAARRMNSILENISGNVNCMTLRYGRLKVPLIYNKRRKIR